MFLRVRVYGVSAFSLGIDYDFVLDLFNGDGEAGREMEMRTEDFIFFGYIKNGDVPSLRANNFGRSRKQN
jgi:hypothetical protein